MSASSLLHVTLLLLPARPVWGDGTSPDFHMAGTLTTSIIAMARYIG